MGFEQRECPDCGAEYHPEFVADAWAYRYWSDVDNDELHLPYCPRCGAAIDADE